MRVILIGAPDTGKQKLAFELHKKFPGLSIVSIAEYKDYATGPLADYRVELRLALDRAEAHLSTQPMIMTHSLVDSLAHSALKVQMEYEVLGDDIDITDTATFWLIRQISEDSFSDDALFFLLPGNNGERFNLSLETIYKNILLDAGIFFHQLTGELEPDVDTCATLIREELDVRRGIDRQRTDTQKSDGKN